MELALDVSNYSGPITNDEVRCWQGLGYRHLVCGTQAPSVTRQQLATASEAGMTVAAYVYLYWRYDIAMQVRTALETVQGFPIERLWLDCEDDVRGRHPAEVETLIAAAVASCDGSPCGLYSGRWWWVPSTGDSAAFAHLPLWHAEYTASPDIVPSFESFRRYGGWSRPAMWQFQGSTSLCGVTVDRNVRLSAAPVPSGPPPALGDAELIELTLLRCAQRFTRALVGGQYVFRPVVEDPSLLELQRVENGVGVSFDPPYVLRAP